MTNGMTEAMLLPPLLHNAATAASSWSFSSILAILVTVYLGIEVAFYVFYHWYLLPRANVRRSQPIPYLDYPNVKDRHLLLEKVITRMQMQAQASDRSVEGLVTDFLLTWFHPSSSSHTSTFSHEENDDRDSSPPPPPLCKQDTDTSSSSTSSSNSDVSSSDTSSSTSSTDGEEEISVIDTDTDDKPQPQPQPSTSKNKYWNIDGMGYDEISEFFAWSLFGRTVEQIQTIPDEMSALQKCLHVTTQRLGLVFPPTKSSSLADIDKKQQKQRRWRSRLRPRCMSFEDVCSLHRPLAVYLLVMAIKSLAGLLLRLLGFYRVVTRSGLVAWVYQPNSNLYSSADANANDKTQPQPQQQEESPLLFFHGIAPAGLVFYLPMVLNLAGRLSFWPWRSRRQRPLVLFEMAPISCTLGFQALSEQETVAGVEEIVREYLSNASNAQALQHRLTMVGHSFGSCAISWILRSDYLQQRLEHIMLLDPVSILLSEPAVMVNFLYAQEVSKIRMIAASELFTEYFLRRNFAWYNSELWLERVPCPVTIALSGRDEIVDAPTVRNHVVLHQQQQQYQEQHTDNKATIKLLYWDKARHADCVTSTSKWRQLRQALLEQEEESAQQQFGRHEQLASR